MAIYTFLYRLYNYEDARLDEVEAKLRQDMPGCDLQELHVLFYYHYSKGLCVKSTEKITPNVHTFLHLLQSRHKNGPLWKTSAEPFEATYAVMRRCYRSGTPNTPKQILTNHMLRIQ